MPYVSPAPTVPNDLGVNRFQPAGRGGSQQEFLTIYDRPIPELVNNYLRHNRLLPFSVLIKSMGAAKGCKNPTTGHYETGWKKDPVSITAVTTASTGAGTNIIVRLTAGSMYDTGQAISGTANQTSYPLVGEIIQSYSNAQAQIIAKNTAVTPHLLTLRPLLSTVDLATHFVADGSYGIVSNAWHEGSTLPASRAPRVSKYRNMFQICKVAVHTTNSEKTNVVYFEIAGQPGTEGQSIIAHMKEDAAEDFESQRGGALLFGQQTTNTINATGTQTSTGLDIALRTTEGFLPFVETAGSVDLYTAGSYALSDLNVATSILSDQRVMSNANVIVFQGPDVYNEIEDLLIDATKYDFGDAFNMIAPAYGQFDGYYEGTTDRPMQRAVSFGFYAISKGGYTLHFKKLDEFADIRGLGSSNYGYRGYNVFMPVGTSNDTMTGEARADIGYEYKELGGYSREAVYSESNGHGSGGHVSNEYDSESISMVCEIAGHFARANRVVVQKPE